MNVYITEVAKRLAARGVEVEIFTRAVCRDSVGMTQLAPGVQVRTVAAGPFEELDKTELPNQICPFTFEVLRAEAANSPGSYDIVHGHYWISGQVGAVVSSRWSIPFVQSMHTLGRVKNAALAIGDAAEPGLRIRGEHEVITAADRLIANTADEGDQLTTLYGADPRQVAVVYPGVDLQTFQPGSRTAARRRLGLRDDAVVVLFAGRVQPLKGPDVVLRTAAALVAADRGLTSRLVVVVVGGPSGNERSDPDRMRELARQLGIADFVRLEPPCPQAELAEWYRAATVLMAPSHSESFGLVALEAQACGTPVVAARVGGLRTVVRDGVSGYLVSGHNPDDYARVLRRIVDTPGLADELGAGALRHASEFGWGATADRLIEVYTGAMEEATTRIRA
jgi:D-inositol-3-phosphate glycosyltransferase